MCLYFFLKKLLIITATNTLNTRYELGNKIIKSSSRLAARQYSKYGLPMFQRVKIYEIMLISEFTDNIEAYVINTF